MTDKGQRDLLGLRVDRAIYRAALSKTKAEGTTIQKLFGRKVERMLARYVERAA